MEIKDLKEKYRKIKGGKNKSIKLDSVEMADLEKLIENLFEDKNINFNNTIIDICDYLIHKYTRAILNREIEESRQMEKKGYIY